MGGASDGGGFSLSRSVWQCMVWHVPDFGGFWGDEIRGFWVLKFGAWSLGFGGAGRGFQRDWPLEWLYFAKNCLSRSMSGGSSDRNSWHVVAIPMLPIPGLMPVSTIPFHSRTFW